MEGMIAKVNNDSMGELQEMHNVEIQKRERKKKSNRSSLHSTPGYVCHGVIDQQSSHLSLWDAHLTALYSTHSLAHSHSRE